MTLGSRVQAGSTPEASILISRLVKAIGAVTMTPFPVDPEKVTIGDVIRRGAETQPNAPAVLSEDDAPGTHSTLAAQIDDIRGRLNGSGLGRGWSPDRENGSNKHWEAR